MSLAVAPPADPSPPPACATHDRSGGYRSRPTKHAVRRFAYRVMGLEPVLEGLTDTAGEQELADDVAARLQALKSRASEAGRRKLAEAAAAAAPAA
ncbi:hypothetical protein EEDFHM_02098 [Methylorubrum populi]